MGEKTTIAWCDATFNPWWGCVKVSPGCKHCYAATFDKRVNGKDSEHWKADGPRRKFGDAHWRQPEKWNRDAEKEGRRRRVFCASMADVFEDRRDLDEERVRLWHLIKRTPWLPRAAGGVCTVQRCACGATRKINSNGRHEERGPWVESQHGGARPGAGRKPTTGTGRLLRLSPPLLDRVASLARQGETPQEHIADLCDQVERVR